MNTMFDQGKIANLFAADVQSVRSRLADIIKEKSLLIAPPDKPFVLVSGMKSTYYINGKKTTSDPEGLYCICRLIWEQIKDLPLDAIGGPTLGADPIVGAYAALSYLTGQPLPLFIVRKEAKGHGTGKMVEGFDIEGKKVVMVEDVITTGGSAFRAIETVQAMGCEVIDVIALVDREQGGKEAFAERGLPYSPFFSISELL
jgi:orotate phosphoribosyltransferase